LPLKAVLLNLLSVSAAYGVLVLVFQHRAGTAIGLGSSPQIEAWIPIFLFATTFGISMDYEVFLLSRVREEWDRRADNERAVAFGLEHTGRIITAAAVIMIAAFSGFLAGSFVGLQEFGLGLAAAILLDATIVRALLVPAAMKLLGRWNWYLPERLRRAMRLRPLQPGAEREAYRLRERCGRADHGRGTVEDAPDRVEVLLHSVVGEGLHDHPRAVARKRLEHVRRDAYGVAHVVQAVEHAHEVVVAARIVLGGGQLEARAIDDACVAGCL